MIDVNNPSRMYNLFNEADGSKQMDCFVPVQDSVVCLYNQGTTDILFDQFSSYGPRGYSDLLSVLALIALAFYFVTSSDSGSYVVDIISANGHTDPPLIQRIFWSITEGATAIALLAAGRNAENSEGSLRALQSASMITGLPYTFILFYCSHALVLLAKEEAGELKRDRKAFNSFIFNYSNWKKHLVNTFAPGIAMGRAASECGGWPGDSFGSRFTKLFWTSFFTILYWAAIAFNFCGLALHNWSVVSGALHTGFGVLLGLVRYGVRQKYQIEHGDMMTDMICGLFVPMFTISQLEQQMNQEPSTKTDAPQKDAPLIKDDAPNVPSSEPVVQEVEVAAPAPSGKEVAAEPISKGELQSV
jgi:hypothetical protein